MDWEVVKDRLLDGVKKYKYALLVLILGLSLMLIPNSAKQKSAQTDSVESTAPSCESLDRRLEDILSQIQGAGKVQVMLTIQSGEEILYQTDQKISSGSSGTSQWDTVIITDANRAESGLITQVIAPTYKGAIIVCEGADKASVRLAVVEAVSKVTGLGADRISVLKMK
ncbi:MAG: hypothetical protein ACI4PO_01665 [Faecousia sp.]